MPSRFLPFLFLLTLSAQTAGQRAGNVTIIRDDWGIAHVYGKTDADAVFGAIYAQAEDDFNRIETNYINAMGRLAEAEGEARIWQDLRMKLFIDPEALKKNYAESPEWLKRLVEAWADGLNFYLAKHPEVKPRVIRRFEPWMAFSFTEGSIGGDIERIDLRQLEGFYGKVQVAREKTSWFLDEPTGSNGIAIAPSNTRNGKALLLINPHTTFFFRSELHMVSEEGLNAYGASTWGQFFIYQGFNDRAGWMHTSSAVDAVDEYLETIENRGGKYFYLYGNETRPVEARSVSIPYKTSTGMLEKKFTVYRTHHGPVVRSMDGKWVAVSLMHKPVEALSQSYLRTKARSYKQYLGEMEWKANSSNNTIYADADGTIAYFHGNFIPRRNAEFDFTRPVDGSNPNTDWKGLLEVRESPRLVNPASGWLYNTNNWPWSAAGTSSPKQLNYPPYVDSGGENARGLHAIRVLENRRDFTLDSLLASAFDSYLPWFEKPIPRLLQAWQQLSETDPVRSKLAEPVAALKGWDFRWGLDSVPTSLGVYWATEVSNLGGARGRRGDSQAASPEQLLSALSKAVDKLNADFGTWKTAWGEINRFQRLTGDIDQPFSDSKPSIPVAFTSGNWGSLASFAARPYPGTKKWYGTSGNSFVAVVEFGDRVRARAVTAGGESGHPANKHFNDQASRYASGDFRDVYFYREQLQGHTERTYRPGE